MFTLLQISGSPTCFMLYKKEVTDSKLPNWRCSALALVIIHFLSLHSIEYISSLKQILCAKEDCTLPYTPNKKGWKCVGYCERGLFCGRISKTTPSSSVLLQSRLPLHVHANFSRRLVPSHLCEKNAATSRSLVYHGSLIKANLPCATAWGLFIFSFADEKRANCRPLAGYLCK
jgi:hypothetical protein